jgi:hypothetical protein
MDKKQELAHMRDSLRKSKVIQGMAMTPARERMLERELTVVRIIGGYKGQSPERVQSSDLVPERFRSRETSYTPTGRGKLLSLSTYVIEIPGIGCGLLPEAVDENGLIHVQSEHGMNIGVLIARAKSPILDQEGHTTRTVRIDEDSNVNGSPLIYSDPGRVSSYPLATSRGTESPQRAEALLITGEKTFLDVLPGRVRMEGNAITGITEILSDKSKPYSGRPDLTLVIKGGIIPEVEEPDGQLMVRKKRPMAQSRGLSLGESVDTYYELESREFRVSPDPNNTYILKFVFD